MSRKFKPAADPTPIADTLFMRRRTQAFKPAIESDLFTAAAPFLDTRSPGPIGGMAKFLAPLRMKGSFMPAQEGPQVRAGRL
jgi:hypothetical protein